MLDLCTVARHGRPIRNPYRFVTRCAPTRTFDTCDNTSENPFTPEEYTRSRHQPLGWEYEWASGEHPDDPLTDRIRYAQQQQRERDAAAKRAKEKMLLTCCHFPETPHA